MLSVCVLMGVGSVASAQEETKPTAEQEQRERPEPRRGEERRNRGEAPEARRGGGESPEAREEARRKRMEARLFQGVELTEEQKQKLKTVGEESRAKLQAWREEHKDELQAIRLEMREARESGDKARAEAAREKLHTLMKDAPKSELEEDVKSVLTEEQQKVFAANLKQWREEMEANRERGERGPRERGERTPGDRGERGNRGERERNRERGTETQPQSETETQVNV